MENEILTLKRERDVATKIETKQKPKVKNGSITRKQ